MTMIYALGTFSVGSSERWPGVVRDGKVAALSDLVAEAPRDLFSVIRSWDVWSAKIDAAVVSADADAWRPESQFVAHLPYMPDNLFGAGANYRKHVIELIVDSGAGGVEHLNPDERRAHGEKEMDARPASGKPFVSHLVGAASILRRNLLIYGLGGIVVPFIGIKLIDMAVTAAHLV